MSDDSHLPSRFRYHNVVRFKDVLKQMVEGVPEIRFQNAPMLLNAGTAKSRVGDAMTAVERRLVVFEDVDADKLLQVRPHYRIDYDTMTGEVVVTQRKSVVTNATGVSAKLAMDIIDKELHVDDPRFDMKLNCALYGFQTDFIRGKVTILGLLDPVVENRIRETPNTVLITVSQNEHILT